MPRTNRPASANTRPLRTRMARIALAVVASTMTALSAGAETHLAQQPDDHVILSFWSFGQNGFCPAGSGSETLYLERVLPDATAAAFTIPKGKRLIVTDFNLTTSLGSSFPRTTAIEAVLRLVNVAKGNGGFIVHRQDFHLVEDHDTVNLTLEGQSLAGISVGEEAALCPEIFYDDGTVGKKRMLVTSGNYRGYLIDAAPSQNPTGGEEPEDGREDELTATTSTETSLTSTRNLYSTLR